MHILSSMLKNLLFLATAQFSTCPTTCCHRPVATDTLKKHRIIFYLL